MTSVSSKPSPLLVAVQVLHRTMLWNNEGKKTQQHLTLWNHILWVLAFENCSSKFHDFKKPQKQFNPKAIISDVKFVHVTQNNPFKNSTENLKSQVADTPCLGVVNN